MYKKIDIFVDGEYVCSTNMSRTCRDAKAKFISKQENKLVRENCYIYSSKIINQIKDMVHNPKRVKCFFSRK